MAGGFSGLSEMSRDDQMRVGLVAVLALSLECVLEGLVTEAELRAWVFHACAAALSVWALFDLSAWLIRLASAAGIVAVGNEALMISEASASMRYLIPSSLLFIVSSWIFQRSVSSSLSSESSAEADGGETNSLAMLGFDLPPPPPPVRQVGTVAPFVIGGGALMSLYGAFAAPWVSTSALLGLFRKQLTLSEVLSAWLDLGAPSGVAEFAASNLQVLTLAALMCAAVGAVASISGQFVVPHPVRLGGVAFIGLVAVLQIVAISGILSADASVRVLAGAWITQVGVALAGYGFWLSAE
jgi:hypothetical protein